MQAGTAAGQDMIMYILHHESSSSLSDYASGLEPFFQLAELIYPQVFQKLYNHFLPEEENLKASLS